MFVLIVEFMSFSAAVIAASKLLHSLLLGFGVGGGVGVIDLSPDNMVPPTLIVTVNPSSTYTAGPLVSPSLG